MAYLPVFLKADGLKVAIFGTSASAIAKVILCLDSGASVRLIGKGAKQALIVAGLAEKTSPDAPHALLIAHDRPFQDSDLKATDLVYICPDLAQKNAHILHAAQKKGLLVNVIDQPLLSNFITPAQFRRGPIEVAFATGGLAPAFARRLRAELENQISPSFAQLAEVTGDLQKQIRHLLPNSSKRRLFLDNLIDRAQEFEGVNSADLSSQILKEAQKFAAQDRAASPLSFWPPIRLDRLAKIARKPRDIPMGLVQLVGAGPGDPELLTIKAHRALQEADIIFYDGLVSDAVLKRARRDAVRVFVGKRVGHQGAGQAAINAQLISEAKSGKRVVRLKSGDPLTFARAGEELSALRKAGIPVQVIAGITALSASAADAQIPLTDRDCAQSITMVTGHTQDGFFNHAEQLLGEGRTIAIYMGLKSAKTLMKNLIAAGQDPKMPIAIIENASRPEKRQFFTDLAHLSTTIETETITSPALILMGRAVTKAQNWPARHSFESPDNILSAKQACAKRAADPIPAMAFAGP